MPTYEYKCKTCCESWEEVRFIRDRDEEAECPCGGVGRRLFNSSSAICVGTFKEGYNPAFGKSFGTKTELNNELAKIKGESGKELFEVGTDSMSTIRKRKKQVDWDSMGKDLKRVLK